MYPSPATFAAEFGQSETAIRSADAALRSIGLTPGRVTANDLVIPIATTVGRAARSLRTGFVSYRLSDGRKFFTNTSAPRLPSSLAAITTAVIGLNDLPYPNVAPPRLRGNARARPAGPPSPPQPHATSPQPCSAASSVAAGAGAWTYEQLAQAYEVNDLFAANDEGKGVNVGLFELDPYSSTDVSTFQTCYGTNVSDAQAGSAGSGPGAGEAALDIETVIAMAPDARVIVYESGGGYGTATVDEYTTIFDSDTVQIVSASYGLCEPSVQSWFPGLIASENTLFEQAATEGITVFAAAGDTGSEGCERSDRSTGLATLDQGSQPFVTSVGGTSLSALGPAPTETVWNESARGAGAGGGGISSVWPMPSWQSGPGVVNSYSTGTPCRAGSGYCREVPDVAADADLYGGYVIYYGGGWWDIGGTSAATPLWAAMIADILSSESPGARVGFLNPLLYWGAAGGSGLFNDITVGNNDYSDVHNGTYPATRGYDMATGLGTPKALGLETLIASPTPIGGLVASFTVYGGTFQPAGTPVTFKSTSSDRPGSIVSYTWSVNGQPVPGGDRATQSLDFSAPQHPGFASYVVSLKVTDNLGQSASASTTVIAEWEPKCSGICRIPAP